jgi:hypothetical protein
VQWYVQAHITRLPAPSHMHEDTQGQRDAWQGCQHLVERATTELALIAHLLGASQDAVLASGAVAWPVSERGRRSTLSR